MDDLYGTDPHPDDDDTIPRGLPHMSVPCHVCQRPVDTLGEHRVMHPFGRSRPRWVVCSDACCIELDRAIQRERDRATA